MPKKEIITGQAVNREKLQRAIELRNDMTPEEAILWEHLRANRLNGLHFRRQQVIQGFIVDFYCHSADLILEVDGEIRENQKNEDAQRDRVFQELGLKILHIKNDAVQLNLSAVLEQIVQIAKAPLPFREGVGG